MAEHQESHNALVDVNALEKFFIIKRGFQKKILKAVDGVSFQVNSGETLGIVGESGCGKTTLGRAILRLHIPTSGTVLFEGVDLCTLSEKEIQHVRGQIQIIFQDPYASLNPRMTVGRMLNQILYSHGVKKRSERTERSADTMKKVGLDPMHLRRYPHEFSGGQRQRIAIARALILKPKFIVADEPSSALDMSIQAQILNLMQELQKELNISYLFITHNLAAAKFICDRIAVMYLGKIVEMATHEQLFSNPLHPYTKALLSLCPTPDPDSRFNTIPLSGEVPSPINPPPGCRFHPRCPLAMDTCKSGEPELIEKESGHTVRCYGV